MNPFLWQVEQRRGSLYLPQVDLWCDAHFPTPFSFVSHAHFDHLAAHEKVIASAGTHALMEARLPGGPERIVLPLVDEKLAERGGGEPYIFRESTELRLYPAGHIFGSAMLHLQRESQSFLYTGDFKLRQGRSAEQCIVPKADVVVMETTFGLPKYQFPPTEVVLGKIVEFCREALEDQMVPVLFGYSLGKSQEILCGLAEAGLPIMLHPQTEKMTQIYVQLGVQFPLFASYSLENVAGHVVICPPQANQSAWLRKIKKRRTAAVTGWAMDSGAVFRYQCDAAFPLSDHADFNDLLKFVELAQPKQVWTVHGSTDEFARTLRERGIEAWPLGKENQLELTLDFGATKPVSFPYQPESPPNPGPSPETVPSETSIHAPAPDDVLTWAQTAEAVKELPGKLAKVKILADYFCSLSTDEALAAAALALTGRAFPTSSGRALNCGWAIVKRAVLAASGLTEGDFRALYLRYSDSGDAAAAALENKTKPEPWPVSALTAFLNKLAELRGPLDKAQWLSKRLIRLDPLAAKYLVKVVTGDLRIGLKEGLVEDAISVAFGRTLEEVKEANMLSGDLADTVLAAKKGTLGSLTLRTFQPIHFMLASPEPTSEAILSRFSDVGEVWLEEKFDGIRCQVHKQGSRVELYSRELRCITGQFHDLADRVKNIPADFVADGELLAWQNGRAMPFAELQKRLGRKGDDFFFGAEVPVTLCLYDLLALSGESLLKKPLNERRGLLDSLPLATNGVAHIERATVEIAKTTAEIEGAFVRARKRGNEGLMAKHPGSIYTPGRRGLFWFKLKKAYATLDVVVVGAEWGHGKRKAVLSDYTFAVRDENTDQLLTVGKAYSGLTDVEIAHFTEHFLENTLVEKGRYREVVPNVILEVAFDTIQASKRHQSGYALRFPRIIKIREDKDISKIDTVAYCRELAANAAGNNEGEAEVEQEKE